MSTASAEGGKVAYITTGTGAHAGPMEIPPTGKVVKFVNYIIQKVENGIAEAWAGWDNLAVLAQRDLFPLADRQ